MSDQTNADPARTRIIAPCACAVAVAFALNLPTAWSDLLHPTTWAVPFELAAAALLLLVLRPERSRSAAPWLAASITLMIVLRWVDYALWRGFGRPLSLATDLDVLPSLLEVVRGSTGSAMLAGGAISTLIVLFLLYQAVYYPLRTVAVTSRRAGTAAALAGVLATTIVVQTAAAWAGLRWQVVGLHGFRQVAGQVTRSIEVREALATWRTAAANDPVMAIPDPELLSRLDGVDVVVIFVESLGRSALLSLPNREPILKALAAEDQALVDAGLHAVSGWLRSPTVGGQSWLAHATLASGVWTDNQASHALYLRSERADLADLFGRAGHRTLLVAPAWVHPYPEAAALGFDQILDAHGLDYRGPPVGWGNIPDQFSLERLVAAIVAPTPIPVSPKAMQSPSADRPACASGKSGPLLVESPTERMNATLAPANAPWLAALTTDTTTVRPSRETTVSAQDTAARSVSQPPRVSMRTVASAVSVEAAHAVADLSGPRTRRPAVYAQVALIGSHAPFTPTLPYVADWESIGDGEVFAALAPRGGSPERVWAEPARIRDAYVTSIATTFEIVGGFVRRLLACSDGRPLLAFVLGDHEPAAIVTGDPAARVVPFYAISSEPELLEPFRTWGLQKGMTPPPQARIHGMDAFRDHLVASFTASAAPSPSP